MSDIRFLVLRGSPQGGLYVRKLLAEPGEVEWTLERVAAHRFADRGAASLVQEQIVARDGRPVSVVPETPNERAICEINAVAFW